MRDGRTGWLVVVLLLLASSPVCAQFSETDTLKAVVPGLVYREYSRTIKSGNDWRVTDPDASYVGDPSNSPSTYLPNAVLSLTVADLQDAIKAVAVIDVWGGHVGTVDKQFRMNGHGWIDVPSISNTPGNPECYTQQYSIEVEIPLEDLVQGSNSIEGTSGGQTCYNFNWGQWGWYGFIVRIYYDPVQKSAPTGAITSPTPGSTIGEYPVFTADASSGAGIDRIDFVGYYDDFDMDGDGVFTDWQQSYHRLRDDSKVTLRNHIGTAKIAPYTVTWDNAWTPDQPTGGMEVVARIKDSNGLWFVTDRVPGLTLSRPGINVEMYQPTYVPEKLWIRAGQTGTSEFVIPAGHDLTDADSARLHTATWNGVSGQAEPGEVHWTTVNGWTTPGFGENHFYSYDVIDIPVDEIQNGTNAVSFYSESSHHGVEVLWPGPGLMVRYTDFTNVPASVITQPLSTLALDGSTATFSIVAVGADPLTYQWQRNGIDIPGAMESTYTTPTLDAGNDGDLYRCAVSNGLGNDLSQEALLTVLVAGPRNTTNQIVLYGFDEMGGTTVNDLSGVGTPADLVIDDPGAVSWFPGGLSIDAATVLSTVGATAKLSNAAMISGELTIEAWVKPANLTQNGPARIVSFSADSAERNFTLGQGVFGEASDVIEVRLRSTTTNLNGKPALSTPEGTLTTGLTHVVFTRNAAGVTTLFVNGVGKSVGQTGGNFSNWNTAYGLALANEVTGGRPWLGEFHLVALFDRALPYEQVLQNFASGPVQDQDSEINVTVFPVQDPGGPVSLYTLPNGQGDPLTAAQLWNGVAGEEPIIVDATIGVHLLDGFGNPVVGFPAEKITVQPQNGGWIACPDSPLIADGPTDASGNTTISGALWAGGFSAAGELMQVIVDDSSVSTTSYPGGLAGLEYFINSPDISGDFRVDLNDVGYFAVDFFSGDHQFSADYVRDGRVNLSDVGKLVVGFEAECSESAGTAKTRNPSASSRSRDVVRVVFDAAGTSSARMIEPGEPIDAYAILNGPTALEGIGAFELRIRVSDNVVIHQQGFVGDGINFVSDDAYVVGLSSPHKALSTRPLQLVHLRVSVTDSDPAYFWVESADVSREASPSVASRGSVTVVQPASGDVALPVASLNDKNFALAPGDIPNLQLSMGIAPNPFNPMTEISFNLPSKGPVRLRIYDTRGQLVNTLRHEVMEAGTHEVMWSGTDSRGRSMASGVYLLRLQTEAGVLLDKMMLVR